MKHLICGLFVLRFKDHDTKPVIQCMAIGLALALSLAAPSPAATIIPTLDGNFAILSNGSVEFTGDSTISGNGTTIGVGAVEYLVVAGGGAGGRVRGGGGGAGGMLTGQTSLTSGSLSVFVGAGGLANSGNGNGQNSSFGNIEATGGGRGGRHPTAGTEEPSAGGSGGGGGGYQGMTGANGIAGQGNQGGNGDPQWSAGGGGGAGEAGTSAVTGVGGGPGGDGLPSSITGEEEWYAGGGGGMNNSDILAAGGKGGGGDGARGITGAVGATAGDPNTGGGGGGGNNVSGTFGGDGGSGVVYVRYAGDGAVASGGDQSGPISGTPYNLHGYTSTGSSSFDLPTGFDASAQHAIFSGNLSGDGGLTKTALGTLTLSGVNTYTGATTVEAGTLLIHGTHTGGGEYTVASGAAIGGDGWIDSALTLSPGATFWWDGVSTSNLTVAGAVTLDSSFGVDSLVGFDWSNVAMGKYTLIDSSSDFEAMSLNHWGAQSAYHLGDGRYAYFSSGSLVLNVVPEPTAWLLLLIAAACGLLVRRRK